MYLIPKYEINERKCFPEALTFYQQQSFYLNFEVNWLLNVLILTTRIQRHMWFHSVPYMEPLAFIRKYQAISLHEIMWKNGSMYV